MHGPEALLQERTPVLKPPPEWQAGGRMSASTRSAWLWSDLHLEFPPQRMAYGDLPVPPPGDLVILAGDIADGINGVRWAANLFVNHPVVYVLGNHEAYHADMDLTLDACRAAASGTNVRVLERETWDVFPGVRVLAATMWTDYALWGQEGIDAGHTAALHLADHHCISISGRTFSPSDARRRHFDTRIWLEAELRRAAADGVRTIVATHHAPHPCSIPPGFRRSRDPFSAAFASDLREILDAAAAPEVWVSGHTHHNHDEVYGHTRLVSNQGGYRFRGEGAGFLREGRVVMRLDG